MCVGATYLILRFKLLSSYFSTFIYLINISDQILSGGSLNSLKVFGYRNYYSLLSVIFKIFPLKK